MTDSQQTEIFERVVRPHFDRLYRLAWRLTGSRTEAEDLFQELLVKAFRMLDDVVKIDDAGTWLCRVMYNLFVDQHRRFSRQRMQVVAESHLAGKGIVELAGDADPVAESERIEKLVQLDLALQRLSEEHRIVVLLHDAEGYKLTEIEEITGVPVGTVKSRLHRARSRLRQMLAEDGTFS